MGSDRNPKGRRNPGCVLCAHAQQEHPGWFSFPKVWLFPLCSPSTCDHPTPFQVGFLLHLFFHPLSVQCSLSLLLWGGFSPALCSPCQPADHGIPAWFGLGGTLKIILFHPAMAGTPPTVPSVQPGTEHCRDPGAATAALAIPSQPLPTLPFFPIFLLFFPLGGELCHFSSLPFCASQLLPSPRAAPGKVFSPAAFFGLKRNTLRRKWTKLCPSAFLDS